MEYEAATQKPDGSFVLLTTYAVNAFGWAEKWVSEGMKVVMVRDRDNAGVIIYTVTACAV